MTDPVRLLADEAAAWAAFAALPAVGPDAWSWFEESGALHYATHMRDLEARSFGGGADGER